MDKLPLERKRLTLNYFIASIGGGFVISLAFFKLVYMSIWSIYVYVAVFGYLALVIIFYFVTLKTNYYQITHSSIIVKKYSKEYEFTFKDMVYIDEEQSLKKKKLIFYGKTAKERYLPFDKDQLIYKAAIKGAKNVMSKEDFKAHYPNVNL